MDEGVAVEAGGRCEQLGAEGFVDGVEGIVVGQPGGGGDDVEAEGTFESAGGAEEGGGPLREPGQPPLDDLPHALGDAQLGHRDQRRPLPVGALLDLPLVDEVAEHLADEEGVAVGLGGDDPGEGLRDLVFGEDLEEGSHRFGGEPVEPDMFVLRLPAQGAEGNAQGMVLARLGVAVGAHHEDRMARRLAGQMAEGVDGALVRPVEVVEAEEDRGPGGAGHDQPGQRVEEPVALLRGRERHGVGEIGQPFAQRRFQLGQRRPAGAQVGAELVAVGGERQGLQQLGEGRPGRHPLALETVSPQDLGAVACRPLGQLLHQPGLADAWFAGHQHQPAPAGGGLRPPGPEAGKLAFPPHKWQAARDQLPGARLVVDGEGGDGLGHALQLELAQVGESEVRAAPQQTGDHVGAEDLAGLRPVAQAPGHDHGQAKVVGRLFQGLAGVESNPDGEVLAVDRPAAVLLHGDGAAHGVGGRGEGDHEPVAQPLDLLSSVGGGGSGQQIVVGPEDGLGLLVPGPGQQFGGAHQVGEEDGDDPRPLGHAPSVAHRTGRHPGRGPGRRRGLAEEDGGHVVDAPVQRLQLPDRLPEGDPDDVGAPQ